MKHATARNPLPETGFLRLDQVLALIPVGRASWWAGVKSGRYPRPVKLAPRTTAWCVEDVRALIEQLSGKGLDAHPRT